MDVLDQGMAQDRRFWAYARREAWERGWSVREWRLRAGTDGRTFDFIRDSGYRRLGRHVLWPFGRGRLGDERWVARVRRDRRAAAQAFGLAEAQLQARADAWWAQRGKAVPIPTATQAAGVLEQVQDFVAHWWRDFMGLMVRTGRR